MLGRQDKITDIATEKLRLGKVSGWDGRLVDDLGG